MRPAYVRLVGNSSLGSNTPRSLLRAVRTYTRVANFVVSTEVGRNERSRILGRILGWGVVHFEDWRAGEDETAISFRRLGWRKISAKADPLSTIGIARRHGMRAFSTDALFENRRTKQRVMVCAVHLPNDEREGAGVARECLERLAFKAQRWRNDPSIDAIIIAGDWNQNWRNESVRFNLRGMFPRAQFTWGAGRAPSGGTHRRNLIDYAAVYGGTITEARLLADDASSDHRPWRMVVRLPRVGA